MTDHRLKIVSTDSSSRSPHSSPSKKQRRYEMQAKMERLWHRYPEKFDPIYSIMEKVRIERIFSLITQRQDLQGLVVVDLGCGNGALTRHLRNAGATVHAVDIASHALERMEQDDMTNISFFQEYVPMTSLSDNAYDLVVAAELIAELPREDHRLFLSELARLVRSDGFVLISTSLDMYSEDALPRFAELVQTEFNPIEWTFSHHVLYIRILDRLAAPERFIKAARDPEYRYHSLEKRQGMSRWWFKWNSSTWISKIWKGVSLISRPLSSAWRKSKKTLNLCEKISAFLWPDSGITHVAFLGQRRPLVPLIPESEQPVERKQKRQVWE